MSTVGALVSAYFCEEYLASRVENLLAQTRVPEILAVCLRGSAEESILRKYDNKHIHIVASLTIPTVYNAWNKAIQETDVDYLCVANSDDEHYFSGVEKMQRALDDHPNVALVYPNVDIVRSHSEDPMGRFELPEYDRTMMLISCYMGPMPMWRRSLHEAYGLFDSQMQVAGDYEFWLRLATHGEEFLHITEVVGRYLSRSDSREHREPIRTLWETARARSRYVQEAYGPTSSQTSLDTSDYSMPVPGTLPATASNQDWG